MFQSAIRNSQLGNGPLMANLASTRNEQARPTNDSNSFSTWRAEAFADLENLIGDAESTLASHFEILRQWMIQQGYELESPLIPSGVPNGQAFDEQLKRIAQQRDQEQSQIRATMQKLSDAWLRLESEQLAKKDAGVGGAVANTTLSQDPTQQVSEPTWESPAEPTPPSYVDRSEPPASLAKLDMNANRAVVPQTGQTTVAESMFHRLRMEMGMKRTSP